MPLVLLETLGKIVLLAHHKEVPLVHGIALLAHLTTTLHLILQWVVTLPVMAFIKVEDLLSIMDKVAGNLVQDMEAALTKVQGIETILSKVQGTEGALTNIQGTEGALTSVQGTEAVLTKVLGEAGANGWVIVPVLFHFEVVVEEEVPMDALQGNLDQICIIQSQW